MSIKHTHCVGVDGFKLCKAIAVFTGIISFILQGLDSFINAITFKDIRRLEKVMFILVDLNNLFFLLCLSIFNQYFKLWLVSVEL
jgi:hypothetical protein